MSLAASGLKQCVGSLGELLVAALLQIPMYSDNNWELIRGCITSIAQQDQRLTAVKPTIIWLTTVAQQTW